MSEENIFTGENPVTPAVDDKPAVQAPAAPAIPPELTELVGEGKKYATVDAALKSILPAQTHIQTLEEENRVAKAELEKRKTAEELIESIKSGNTPTETPESPSIDVNTIGSVVQTQLEAIKQAETAKANTDTVANKFTEKFGDKAEEVYNKIAADSGLPVESLNQLAAASPNAVLKLAGLDSVSPDVVEKPTSSVNTETQQAPATDNNLTAKLPKHATTKDVVNAWHAAGEIVKNRQNS